jgi:hypothetical protein
MATADKTLSTSRDALSGRDDNPVTVLRVFLQENNDSDDVNVVCSELKRLQMSRGLDDQHKVKVGGATSALVTLICVLCTLRTQKLTIINMQLYTLSI